MWKLINISQQSYFIHCKFTSSQEVTFILYDLKETWCKSLSFNELRQNVKLLNKRYDFNEAIIRDTLLNGEIQTAIIEQQPHTSSTKQESCIVKLKYLVKNCPFHLEWSLRRQTLEEFQSTFMQPLFAALQGCFQQVEILTDVVHKKDAELIQYRKEGAILHRKTLATKTFDFNDFNEKYKATTELAANYAELAKFVINTKSKVEVFPNDQVISNKATKDEVSLAENLIATNNSNTKMSPKQRKRKILEMKQHQLENNLKVRKQHFEYESSQSQSSYSQLNDETLQIATEHKDSNEELQRTPKKETKSESEHKFTPRQKLKLNMNYEENKSDSDDSEKSNKITPQQRKLTRNLNVEETGLSINTEKCKEHIESIKLKATCNKTAKIHNSLKKSLGKTSQNINDISESESEPKSTPRQRIARCVPIKNYEENNLDSDNKTDSDDNDESNKITLRKRKSTKNLNTEETEISPNTDKNKVCSERTKHNLSDTGDKTTKSLTLSYNSVKKSPVKTSQNLSNVYDFPTDAENENTTNIRKKLMKTSPNMTENRKTRSSQQSITEIDIEQQRKSPLSEKPVVNKSKTLSHSSTPVTDDISSQLDAIKKELESLEALRLADLQQRMCKT